MADHLGFMFAHGASGLPGFPDPFKRHDPKKTNSLKDNARHIRDALDMLLRRKLGGMSLREFWKSQLTVEQFAGLTEALANLIYDLQNHGYIHEQIGAELGDDILKLLQKMGYIP